jgi:hypothetical protein
MLWRLKAYRNPKTLEGHHLCLFFSKPFCPRQRELPRHRGFPWSRDLTSGCKHEKQIDLTIMSLRSQNYWVFRRLIFGTFIRPIQVTECTITSITNLIISWPLREVPIAIRTFQMYLIQFALEKIICRLPAMVAFFCVDIFNGTWTFKEWFIFFILNFRWYLLILPSVFVK